MLYSRTYISVDYEQYALTEILLKKMSFLMFAKFQYKG